MFPTKMHEKEKVKERISSGEIVIGNKIVPSSYNKYSINPDTQALQLNRVSFSARKIPLNQIRGLYDWGLYDKIVMITMLSC